MLRGGSHSKVGNSGGHGVFLILPKITLLCPKAALGVIRMSTFLALRDQRAVRRGRMGILFACSFATLTLIGVSASAGDKKTSTKSPKTATQQQSYVAPTDPALYVGPDTCKTCHEEISTRFEHNPHFTTTMEGKLEAQKGAGWEGCEACHGPGKAHVDGGGDKTKIFTFKNASAQEISSRCLGCHTYGEEHSNYARSAHLQNNVSCVDCHSPHHPKETEHLMKEKQPQLCYGCHLET